MLKKHKASGIGNNASKLVPNWRGDPIALPYIFLTSLNKVENANMALEGILFTDSPKSVNMAKFWGSNRALSLQLKNINLKMFEFKGSW